MIKSRRNFVERSLTVRPDGANGSRRLETWPPC